MFLLAPFIAYNFEKLLGVDPELGRCAIFGPKLAHLPQTRIFSEKSLE